MITVAPMTGKILDKFGKNDKIMIKTVFYVCHIVTTVGIHEKFYSKAGFQTHVMIHCGQ